MALCQKCKMRPGNYQEIKLPGEAKPYQCVLCSLCTPPDQMKCLSCGILEKFTVNFNISHSLCARCANIVLGPQSTNTEVLPALSKRRGAIASQMMACAFCHYPLYDFENIYTILPCKHRVHKMCQLKNSANMQKCIVCHLPIKEIVFEN